MHESLHLCTILHQLLVNVGMRALICLQIYPVFRFSRITPFREHTSSNALLNFPNPSAFRPLFKQKSLYDA